MTKAKKFPWVPNGCGFRLLALSLHWLCGLGIGPLSLSFFFYKMWMNSNVYLCCRYLNEISSAGSSACILPTIAHTQSAPRTHSQISVPFLGYVCPTSSPEMKYSWEEAGRKQQWLPQEGLEVSVSSEVAHTYSNGQMDCHFLWGTSPDPLWHTPILLISFNFLSNLYFYLA